MTVAHAHRRPNTRTYWLVALFLAVVTAIEIGISYIEGLGNMRPALLIAFGAVKFFTVVGIFMHLRYDISTFRAYFLVGLFGAISVFIVVLATFRVL